MKKNFFVFMAVLLTFLSGCKFKGEDVNESTIFVNRDGSIESVIIEDFPEDKYSADELNSMLRDSVLVYNGNRDLGDVKIISCDVINGVAKVLLNYNSGSDYADFNNRDFYFGTVSAALDAGYAKTATLKNAHGTNTITGNSIYDMATYHMLVFDESVNVKTYASILYYSSNLTIIDENTVTRDEDAKGLSYIIIK